MLQCIRQSSYSTTVQKTVKETAAPSANRSTRFDPVGREGVGLSTTHHDSRAPFRFRLK